jgi:hypothetical protein
MSYDLGPFAYSFGSPSFDLASSPFGHGCPTIGRSLILERKE